MAQPGHTRHTGLKRIVMATGYSLKGLLASFRHETAFRQELVLVAVLAPAGYGLGQSAVERSLLIGSLLLVLIVELLNSAVESVVDRIGDEQHELAGRAKDQGSAAVMISLLLVIVTWGAIALERFGQP